MRHQILIVCADPRVEPELLTGAIDDALVRAPRGEIAVVRVLIPAVLPPTLPISAWPPRLAARLNRLREAAEQAAGALELTVPGRDRAVPERPGAFERGLAGRRARPRRKRGVGRSPRRPWRGARCGDRSLPEHGPPPQPPVRASQGASGVDGGQHGQSMTATEGVLAPSRRGDAASAGHGGHVRLTGRPAGAPSRSRWARWASSTATSAPARSTRSQLIFTVTPDGARRPCTSTARSR